MTQFDEDRLPALRRLHSLLVNDPTACIKAPQFDAYLTTTEREQWRQQLAEYESIKRQGVEAQLSGTAAISYWIQLRALYASAGLKKTVLQKRAFQNNVEELWEEFQILDAVAAGQFREATGADERWNKISDLLEEEFHIIQDGSYFQPWWDYPKNFVQRELLQALIGSLTPDPDTQLHVPGEVERLRKLMARHNR